MLGNDRKTTGGRFGEKLLFMNKLAEGVGPKWTGTSIKETRQFERSVAARMKIDVGGAGSVKGLLEAVYKERITPSPAAGDSDGAGGSGWDAGKARRVGREHSSSAHKQARAPPRQQ